MQSYLSRVQWVRVLRIAAIEIFNLPTPNIKGLSHCPVVQLVFFRPQKAFYDLSLAQRLAGYVITSNTPIFTPFYPTNLELVKLAFLRTGYQTVTQIWSVNKCKSEIAHTNILIRYFSILLTIPDQPHHWWLVEARPGNEDSAAYVPSPSWSKKIILMMD